MISVLASLKKNLSNIWENTVWSTETYNFIPKSFSLCWLFCNSILIGNFSKGEFYQVCDFCGVSVATGWVYKAFERQQSFTELRPSASKAPLPRTGRKDSGTRARWPLLSHLTECHWSWLREGHLLQPLGEWLGYHGYKREEGCADAVNKIKLRVRKKLWRRKGGTIRHEPSHQCN